MGQALGNLKNAGNIQEANLSDLSPAEKLQRGILGGLGGGIQGMQQQAIQQKPRNPFYGGY